MRLALLLSILLPAAAHGVAAADPAVDVVWVDGVAQIRLEGSYAGSYYVVLRADAPEGEFRPITGDDVLCLGSCLAPDPDALPGRTYFYRFDLTPPQGQALSYGPYAVRIPNHPVLARLLPNPSRGAARVTLSLPGSARETPVSAEARILDVQGRTVRLLHRGLLARGTTTLDWDGRGDDGRGLEAGVYFVRLTSPLGSATTRVIRIN